MEGGPELNEGQEKLTLANPPALEISAPRWFKASMLVLTGAGAIFLWEAFAQHCQANLKITSAHLVFDSCSTQIWRRTSSSMPLILTRYIFLQTIHYCMTSCAVAPGLPWPSRHSRSGSTTESHSAWAPSAHLASELGPRLFRSQPHIQYSISLEQNVLIIQPVIHRAAHIGGLAGNSDPTLNERSCPWTR